MIDKINNNRIQDILKDSTSRQADSKGPVNNQIDTLSQVDSNILIENAKKLPSEDAQAVQKARELLLSGQLDSEENIRAAAENILKYGI